MANQGFASRAQRTHWEQMVAEGKVTAAQFAARDLHSPSALPERASPRHRTVGASRAPAVAKKPRY
jgi:hypothetical protein